MFNPEKILGSLLKSGIHGKGVGALASGGAALGLLGVAMEAVEHYMNRSQTSNTAQGPPSGPPPLPGGSSTQSGPPPLPGNLGGAAPPPPPQPLCPSTAPASGTEGHDAVLLIRAMIAAANADGMIDADERAQIMAKLKTAELSPEEHQFIGHELLAPQPMDSIVREVKSPEMARQIYAASLMAITVDTDAERDYLAELAKKLELEPRVVDDIHQQFALNELGG